MNTALCNSLYSYTVCNYCIYKQVAHLIVVMLMHATQTNSVTASVPRLSDGEFVELLAHVQRAALEMTRPLSRAEYAAMPRHPRNAVEFFAYTEPRVRRIITALKALPHFRALSFADQLDLLKVRFCSAHSPEHCSIHWSQSFLATTFQSLELYSNPRLPTCSPRANHSHLTRMSDRERIRLTSDFYLQICYPNGKPFGYLGTILNLVYCVQ